MLNPRNALYNALLMTCVALPLAGCGQPKAPPPGAPEDPLAPPTIETSDSGAPQEPTGGTTDSPEGRDAPGGESGAN